MDWAPESYGDRIAGVYDDHYPQVSDEQVDLLAELAHGGPVLELGIGTGRVALPLAARGVDVHGLDASQAMVDRLRAKPGGEQIPVAIRDMADLSGLGPFRMVFVAFNTFFALMTQDDQVRCFESVASALEPGGRFVMEAFVPDLSRFDRNQRVNVVDIDNDVVHIDVAVHDPATQTVSASRIVFGPSGREMYPVQLRFAYPPELDLMARIAGLRPAHRWAGWNREPYTGVERHVSVFEKPA